MAYFSSFSSSSSWALQQDSRVEPFGQPLERVADAVQKMPPAGTVPFCGVRLHAGAHLPHALMAASASRLDSQEALAAPKLGCAEPDCTEPGCNQQTPVQQVPAAAHSSIASNISRFSFSRSSSSARCSRDTRAQPCGMRAREVEAQQTQQCCRSPCSACCGRDKEGPLTTP